MDKTKIKVFPWHTKSKGAKELSKSLDIQRIKLEGSSFKGGKTYTVINWGSAKKTVPFSAETKVINKFSKVNKSSNKRRFFELIINSQTPARIPEFTSSLMKATKLLESGQLVLARKERAFGGHDIIFPENDFEKWQKSDFFTVYKKKKEEYRVHIAFGDVICTQQKVLRKTDEYGNQIDPKQVDFRIRNWKNGFVFKRHDLHTPPDAIYQAMLAYDASGLDFGAFDVIWNQAEEKAYVLEVNCAPGLEGSTVDDYAKAFKENL